MTLETVNSLDFFGLRLEEGIYRLLRVGNDESFFLWSALTFWCFLRLHKVLLSSRFLFGESGMPQPGIGPGSPEWARDCKSRLSASSSTGAQNSGGEGPRTLNKPFSRRLLYPVELHPHWEGIPGVDLRNALDLLLSKWNVVVCDLCRLLEFLWTLPAKINLIIFLFSLGFVRVIHEASEHFVDGSHGRCVFGKIESFLLKLSAYVLGGQPVLRIVQYHSDSIGNTHSSNALSESEPSQRSKVIEHFFQMPDLSIDLAKLGLQARTLIFQAALLRVVLRPLLVVI